jgi:hypothetical protein
LKEFLNKVRPEFKSDDDILEDIQYWLVNQQHFKAPNAKVLRATLYGRLCEMLRGKEIEFLFVIPQPCFRQNLLKLCTKQ